MRPLLGIWLGGERVATVRWFGRFWSTYWTTEKAA